MNRKQKKVYLKHALTIGLTLCGIMPGVGAQEFNEGITGSKSTDEIYVTTGVLKDRKYTFTEDTKIHVNNHSKNAVFYKEVNESGGQKSKIWIMAGISSRNGKVNIDAKGKELTVGLGYEKLKENEPPIEWPVGIYVENGKSIKINAKRLYMYNSYEGKKYGANILFDGVGKPGKLSIIGDLDISGEKNGTVDLGLTGTGGEFELDGSYRGGHISGNLDGGFVGKITINGDVDIKEDNSRKNALFVKWYRSPPMGLSAKDITVNGNVNISINSENYDSWGYQSSFDKAKGIVDSGKLYIGGDLTIRGVSEDKPWGVFIPYFHETSYGSCFGIWHNSDEDAFIGGNTNLVLRTGTGVFIGNNFNIFKHKEARGMFYLAGDTKIEMYPHLRSYTYQPYEPIFAINVNGHSGMIVNMGQDGKRPGNKNVEIDGNIGLHGATAFNNPSGAEYSIPKVTLALTNKDSHWTGVSFLTGNYEPEVVLPEPASFNLYLRNGARWNNRKHGAVQHQAGRQNFSGSEVTRFYGGLNREGKGIVHMHDTAPLTIGEYEGHTLF
ncbi:hypothetical protein, partial [Dialister invisus]